jgi:hypothetical protein
VKGYDAASSPVLVKSPDSSGEERRCGRPAYQYHYGEEELPDGTLTAPPLFPFPSTFFSFLSKEKIRASLIN